MRIFDPPMDPQLPRVSAYVGQLQKKSINFTQKKLHLKVKNFETPKHPKQKIQKRTETTQKCHRTPNTRKHLTVSATKSKQNHQKPKRLFESIKSCCAVIKAIELFPCSNFCQKLLLWRVRVDSVPKTGSQLTSFAVIGRGLSWRLSRRLWKTTTTINLDERSTWTRPWKLPTNGTAAERD